MEALLIIDPQNSFCNPGNEAGKNKGSLYIDGADKDMKRLAGWIIKNKQKIDFIAITLDNHHLNDIAHPDYWTNPEGKAPEPFTQITVNDIKEKKWLPLFEPKLTLDYLTKLEANGEFPHTIWPIHCLIGSESAAVYPPVMAALEDWAKLGTFYATIQKGAYPFSEHFGAFKAQVPDPNVPETLLNARFLNTLEKYDTIYLAGEAKSHCVANTLKQLIEDAPELVKKMIILEDTMSNVAGFETIADPIYKKAKEMGVMFVSTEEIQL